MKKTTLKKLYFKTNALIIAFVFILATAISCSSSKNDPGPTEPEIDPELVEEPETPDYMFNQLITVKNLHTPHEVVDGKAPFTLYSLEQKTIIESKYKQTRLWDISFDNMYSSFINANNKKEGYGKDGLGGGGIIMIKKKFEDVIDIPTDNEFRTGDTPYGPDDSGDWAVSGFPDGWFRYDGSSHVCYPIEEHTLVVRTARGNYAKIKIHSVYEDQLDPEQWTIESPKTYYTMDYVLAKKGSKTFEIKTESE